MKMDGEKEKLKEKRYNDLYMDLAERISKMSHAKRLQVGSVLVKNDNILSYGWNGCLLYTSPSPRDRQKSRMPSSA